MFYVFIINAGSSSVKFQLLEMEKRRVVAKGGAERIGSELAVLSFQAEGKEKFQYTGPLPTHLDAIQKTMDLLIHDQYGVLGALSDIAAVGHRVSHGGEELPVPVLVTPEVKAAIGKNIELAPLHNPAQLTADRKSTRLNSSH